MDGQVGVMHQMQPLDPAQAPPYEPPPPWIPPEERLHNSDYNNDLRLFLPRTIVLRRMKPTDALGFNIRGGIEHNFGLYVSKVTPNSEAYNLGIKEGDQILDVNRIDFQAMDHSEAVHILKMNTTVEMTVRYFPYGYVRMYDRNRQYGGNMATMPPSSQSQGYS